MFAFLERFKQRAEANTQSQRLNIQASTEIPQGIQIERFDLKRDIDQVANLYASVFAGPPWNEYTQCGECNKFAGKETCVGDSCPHCQTGSLSLAYPLNETIGLVREASTKPNATMFVARDGDSIVGFIWGYTHTSRENLLEAKSSYSEAARQQIEEVLNENDVKFPIFYFAEVGISEEARGQHLSDILVQRLVDKAGELNQSMLMTTNWKTKMISVAKKFGMRLILGPESYYDKPSDIVVKTGNIAHAIDAEREDRTLFLLEPNANVSTQGRRILKGR